MYNRHQVDIISKMSWNEKDGFGRSRTILVVDDDPLVRSAFGVFLRKAGYDVLEAEDGSSALEIFRRHDNISLVLSDVVMPGGLSGLDLAEEIYRVRRNAKVVLMSGYPIREIDKDGTLRDRFVFLTKPCNPDEILAAVQAATETSN